MTLKAFKNYKKYLHKALLGVDFGEKKIGLAIYTPGQDPYPLRHSTLSLIKNQSLGVKKILEIILAENIHSVIFGLPLPGDGREGEMAKRVKLFAKTISEQSPCPILFQDEYLSSQQAKEHLFSQAQHGLPSQKEHIHQESARIILEDFIRSEGVE